MPLGIAAGAVVLTAVVSFAMPLVSQLKSIAENSGIKNEYFILMLKSLGICYITQFAADICTDFGQSSLASKIELFRQGGIGGCEFAADHLTYKYRIKSCRIGKFESLYSAGIYGKGKK